MVTLAALKMLTPSRPDPCPSMSSPSSRTSEPAGALMPMAKPGVCMAAVTPMQRIEIDLVIATMPKSPESRQLISPPVKVFAKAPANVRQGDVRVQGLASLPEPETQLREFCAAAGSTCRSVKRDIARTETILCFIVASQCYRGCRY